MPAIYADTTLPTPRSLSDADLYDWFNSYRCLCVGGVLWADGRDSWGEIIRRATPEEIRAAHPLFVALRNEVIRRAALPRPTPVVLDARAVLCEEVA